MGGGYTPQPFSTLWDFEGETPVGVSDNPSVNTADATGGPNHWRIVISARKCFYG
ncbi:MAG: hypothetical protein H6554_04080 [Chitinophagales bacterium]|nr:hypothetical protein [Chitinophagales bacterium]